MNEPVKNILDIASKHLGNKGEYAHYEGVDAKLLVAIPRALSRAESNVTVRMDGYDVWNCYEFSALRRDGVPVSGRLKLSYDSNSEFLVESKSLKLYLNSWNFENAGDDIKGIEARISADLEAALKTAVQVTFSTKLFDDEEAEPVDAGHFKEVDLIKLDKPFDYKSDKDSRDYLRRKPGRSATDGEATQLLFSGNLRSNCRVTHQPDWGDVFIRIKGNQHVGEATFVQYLLSLRKQDHFHEECCEMILNDLFNFLKPSEISVMCLYTRRGGIDINPVRFKGGAPIAHADFRNTNLTFKKTFRQ